MIASFEDSSWLWHKKLEDASMELLRKMGMRGSPKLKFEKDHIVDAYQMVNKLEIHLNSGT